MWEKTYTNNTSCVMNNMGKSIDGGFFGVASLPSSGEYLEGFEYTYKNYDNNYNNQVLLKYSAYGDLEWMESVHLIKGGGIRSVAEKNIDEYIIGGYSSKGFFLDSGEKIERDSSYYDGFICNVKINRPISNSSVLEIENTRKEYNVTTGVEKIDGKANGTITGEEQGIYEIVKHGDANTKPIVITPDTGYEISQISINGKAIEFVPNGDDTYTLPVMNNINENKDIRVTFALKNNKVTITKKDTVTGEVLEGTQIQIDQIENRTEPIESEIIKELKDNGNTFIIPANDHEVTGVLRNITKNGEYYFVENENEDGTTSYVPTNSKTWRVNNVEGATAGAQGCTANSYFEINLEGLTGNYCAVVNSYVSSESGYDYGYASISQSTEAPTYDTNNETISRFIYSSGDTGSSIVVKDTTTKIHLQGGNTYYLHLGYRKDSAIDRGEDQFYQSTIIIMYSNI